MRWSLGVTARVLALSIVLPLSACGDGCAPTPPGDGGPSPTGDGGVDGDGGVAIADAGPPREPIREPDPTNPDNPRLDSDCDGISDAEEFTATYAGGARTDPANWDSDGDGIADGVEAGRSGAIDDECPQTWTDADPATRTNPTAGDTDGDCIPDGIEDRNRNGRVDEGESDPVALDSDGDGIPDGEEDASCDGVVDAGETHPGRLDTDGDGINDRVERDVTGTDPANPDTDGDNIPDGIDDNPLVADADADGDGLSDARETQIGTDPNGADSDGDGLCDGPIAVPGTCAAGEDRNGNGQLDPGETDPNDPDTDCDAVSDGEEQTRGTDPRARDTDGDLIPDGVELGKSAAVANGCVDPPLDAEPASTTDPLAIDSDGDGLNDGIEDRNRDGQLAPPSPGAQQETDPTDGDTDNDALCDGPNEVTNVCVAGEDRNRNGRVDAGETDPRVADTDSDGDGLSNQLEMTLGTNPMDEDTDDDGLADGAEVLMHETNPLARDTDCDGVSDGEEVALGTDANRFDSDGDGVSDGVELGRTTNLDPARCAGRFVPDADPATTTDPVAPDSDGDGVVDGAEDGNQNGRVDPGELDPRAPGDANSGAINAACAQPIDPSQHARSLLDVLLATAPDFAAANTADIVMDGTVVGVTVTDPTHGLVAFAIHKAPEGASPSDELSTLEARIGGLTLPLVQPFTTWDLYDAARGTYDLSGAQQLAARTGQVARRVLNRALNDAAVVVPATNAPAETGPFKLGLEVVRRSANTSIVVGVLTRLSSYNDPASGRDFRLEDLAGGTALGQVGDAIGTQCDVFASQERQPVDFVWVLDNSGSMGDELNAVQAAADQMVAQLDNSTLDWRIAVVTTEFNLRTSGPTFSGSIGTCGFDGADIAPGGSRVCICQFVTSTTAGDFQSCVGQIKDLGGSGAEGSYGPLKSALTDVFTNAAYSGNARLRANARLVGIFITDAGEQTPQSTAARQPYAPSNDLNASVTSWKTFFQGGAGANTWDPTTTNEPPMIVSGILCPFNANCAGEEDSTGTEAVNFNQNGTGGHSMARDRYYRVINELGGVIGAIASPQGGTLANLGDIATTIEGILNVVIGTVTPYELSHDPIASTIKVAVEGPVEDAQGCNGGNLSNVPRSRIDGFGYDATTNRLSFFGACRPTTVGTDIAASYRTWIDLTQDPDGADQPCNGQCQPPFVCVNDQCLCPSDCGTGAELPPSQTCNPATCTPECLDDCGGACGGGQVCDPGTCECTCPQDCNGAQPGANFICDPSTCQWTCAPDGCDPSTRPAGAGWTCGAACEWECPADCGTDLAPGQQCNRATCEVECAPDCNGACGGYETCNTGTCACECLENATCAAGFVFDAQACGCVCDAAALACPATHEADLDSCSCRCITDDQGVPTCGGSCTGGQFCDTGSCACIDFGG